MSVLQKMSQTLESIKNFDDEKSVITMKSDSRIVIETYKSIRLFSDTEIEIEFDDFVAIIKGTGLVINEFNPGTIKLSGLVSSVEYTRE